MKRIISIAVIILLAVIQLSLTVPQFLPSIPNLLLIYLCLSFLFIPIREVLILTLISGIFLDFFSGLPDGVMLLALTAAIIGAYHLAQMMFSVKYSNYITLFYIVSSTIIFSSVVVLFAYILELFGISESVAINGYLIQKVGVDTIVNVLLLYPVYWLYQLQERVEKRFKLKNESI